MRTTIAIDDELLAKAQAYTGLIEKSRSGARGAESVNRAGGRTPISTPRGQRARHHRAAHAAGWQGSDSDRTVGVGRSLAVGRSSSCAAPQRWASPRTSLRDRRTCPRQFAATSAYPEYARRPASGHPRFRRGGAAFHRRIQALRVRYRLRRRPFAGGYTVDGARYSVDT